MTIRQPANTARQTVANLYPTIHGWGVDVTITPENLFDELRERTRGNETRYSAFACDLREFSNAAHLVFAVDFPNKGREGREYNFLPSRFLYFWTDKEFFAFTNMLYKAGASWIGAFHAPDGKDREIPDEETLGKIAIEGEAMTRAAVFEADLDVAKRTYLSRDLKSGDGLRHAEWEYRSFVVDCINYHLRTFKKSVKDILDYRYTKPATERLLLRLWEQTADRHIGKSPVLPYAAETLFLKEEG